MMFWGGVAATGEAWWHAWGDASAWGYPPLRARPVVCVAQAGVARGCHRHRAIVAFVWCAVSARALRGAARRCEV